MNSVAKGPKFRPKNTKEAKKIVLGPEKGAADFFWHIYPKRGQKGAELFCCLVWPYNS
jgi:hypothetical protein